jgi:hypothetical protein
MTYVGRLALLLALALAAVALTAANASAVVKDATQGGTASGTTTGAYSGSILGTETGPIIFGGATCLTSNVSGTVNGSASTATLSFTFGSCTTNGGSVACTVDPINNMSTTIAATGGGNGVITQASNFSTTITCVGVYVCTASSTTTAGGTAGAGPVTAPLDAGADTATINDAMRATGPLGCTSPGTWNGVYTVAPTTLEVW